MTLIECSDLGLIGIHLKVKMREQLSKPLSGTDNSSIGKYNQLCHEMNFNVVHRDYRMLESKDIDIVTLRTTTLIL